jgi:hypothetical protein
MALAATRLTIETGTTALTGLSCFKILILTDTVFSVLTPGPGTYVDGDALSGATFPKGAVLELSIIALTLTSGTIAIYQAV